MKSIYIIKAYDGVNTYMTAVFTKKRIAIAWKRYYESWYPNLKHDIVEVNPIDFMPMSE